MINIFVFLIFIYWVVALYVLVQRYRRTHEEGYVWFIGALVVWPMLRSGWTIIESEYITRLTNEMPANFFPFSLVTRGFLTVGELLTISQYVYQLVYGILIIVAIVKLNPARERSLQHMKG